MKNKIIVLTLLVMTGLMAVVWLAGCSEKIVNENNGQGGLTLEPNFTVKGNLEAVSIYRVRVEAEDIPVPIETTLNIVNGFLVGDIEVPVGRKRKITVEAMDKELNVIYRGVRILDIYPSSVELPVIGIDLLPTVPIIRVTPHYTRLPMGISFSCDVEVFSIPNLYSTSFSLRHYSDIARLDSVTRGASLEIDDYFTASIYWLEVGQEANVSVSATEQSVSLVDGTGYAHLATFYFSSYSVWDEDLDIFGLILQLNNIWGNEGGIIDTIPRAGIFVDQGQVEMPRRYWELAFGGSGAEYGHDIVQTPDGNFAIVGYTNSFGAGNYDAYLLRIDSLGNYIGDKTYGGASYDYGTAIINTRDGGLAIVGYTDVGTVASNYDVMFIKTDPLGNPVDTNTYGTGLYEFGYDLKQTTDGGYIIVGSREDSVYLIKTDASGNVVWDNAYEDTVSSHRGLEGKSIIQTSDGGYLVVGQVWFPDESRGGYLMKVNAQGTFSWDLVVVGTINCSFNSIAKTSDGNYVVTGEYDNDVYLLKINSGGTVLWNKFYGGSDSDEGYSVVTCPDGGFFVTGYFYDGLYDKVGEMYLIKTDPSGEIVWDTTFGDYNTDYGYSGITTSDGGFISCGYTYNGEVSNEILVIKTDASGKTYTARPSK